ncbi:YtpR family tRNA-binding protein [Alkalihalobacillus pseudalcaliphilus]|uniref:YtpR family tRNA-binding protein n=1 Tax=Alkalihalobacillus pseudalcaliphilus TaxID=79884 RepID=UPI00064DEFBE|nr:DUF4479 family protein [Alkalihalobacillus pseudalcaliphilus]KMK77808.1 tRNA-binding protein [Alkalihalobacillus pseudalcaliphilus]
MNVFYNEKGVGDTLLLFVKDIELEKRAFSKHGDVVRIYDQDTKELSGFNIFHASKYGQIVGTGQLEVNSEMKQLIQKAFSDNKADVNELQFEDQASFVVGLVKEKDKHPNADKLSVCQVDLGEQTVQIVCGAPNVEAGQKVVVATVDAVMPSGLKIKAAKLRGVDSHGMICSAKELQIPNAPEEKGILVLEDAFVVGSQFDHSLVKM